MCGIVGAKCGSVETIEKMLQALSHRGPDDNGIIEDRDSRVILGNCRLAIQDLTSAAHMPMCDNNEKACITYNGEVYNFLEIRAELESKGYNFKSNSDTEIVLASYLTWGTSCLKKLRGMFAFAIWDKERRELFLARDRFGIKPLYWSSVNKTFLFSSEIKGLLVSGMIQGRVDYQSLWDYLSLGAVPPPKTMVRDINALLPGHAMIVRDRDIRIWKYWDLDEVASNLDVPKKEAEAKETLLEILKDVSMLHMIADVKVGIFLSGGVDSTSMVGLLSQNGEMPLNTYSVGFANEDQSNDELKYARIAAERFNTDHTEYILRGDDIAEGLQSFFRYIDQPTTDGLNTYLISRKASTDVKVAISGLGSDELFAGYPQFRRLEKAGRWLPIGNSLMGNISKHLPSFVPGRIRNPMEFYASDMAHRHTMIRTLFSEYEKLRIVRKEILGDSKPPSPIIDYYKDLLGHGKDIVQETTYVETYGYMARTLLRDADSLSMANSLELRVPFIDHKLAEFVYALPSELKLSRNDNKYILKTTLKDILPEEIKNRSKVGFNLPLRKWLSGPLKGFSEQSLSLQQIKDIFEKESLEEMKCLLNSAYYEKPWSIIVLGNWMEQTGISL